MSTTPECSLCTLPDSQWLLTYTGVARTGRNAAAVRSGSTEIALPNRSPR